MGTWYWIGLSAGLGVALGVGKSGLPYRRRLLWDGLSVLVVSALLAHFFIESHRGGVWDVVACALGGLSGYLGSVQVVAGALRRGGTRLGLALLVIAAALVLAGIAFIPAAGYLEAVVIPAFALRLRQKQPERYAGLRTLAKD